MTNDIQSQVSFLPYISLENEIKIGDFLFWKFYENKEDYLGDNHKAKDHLEKLFRQYLKHSENTPIETITVASFKKPDNFTRLKDNQMQ